MNTRYKTPIENLPTKINNGRKRKLTITSTETKICQISPKINTKMDSLSDKEIQSIYITVIIILYDMFLERKNKKNN